MKGFEEITNKNFLINIIINKKIKLMKRNFLLTLLLTLLPFVGWAADGLRFSLDGGDNFVTSVTVGQLNSLTVWYTETTPIEDVTNESGLSWSKEEGSALTPLVGRPTEAGVYQAAFGSSYGYLTVTDGAVAEIVGGSTYPTLQGAIEAVQNGQRIRMLESVTLEEQISINKVFTIDLNGKNISSKGSVFVIVGGSLTLNGEGTVQCVGNNTKPDFSKDCAVKLGGYDETGTGFTAPWTSNLTVGDKVTLIGGNSGVFIQPANAGWKAADGVSVDIAGTVYPFGGNDGTASGPTNEGYMAIYLHGNVENISENAPKITIQSTANIQADQGPAIYAAGYGIWSIEEGATIKSAAWSALEARAGKFDIEGGEFSNTYNDPSDPYGAVSNPNGASTYGAAFGIAQHTTKLPINVTIEGGEFTGPAALYVANPENNSEDNVVVSVTGGQFGGKVEVAHTAFNTKFLAGGEYSIKPSEGYIADGFYAKDLKQGDEEITYRYKVVKDISNLTITPSPINLFYTGESQLPLFTRTGAAEANAFVKDGDKVLVENEDYVIKPALDADYINIGKDKVFYVEGIGSYGGQITGKFNILRRRIAINPAHIHKTYGDPDPVAPVKPAANATQAEIDAYNADLAAYTAQLNFEVDAATPLQGEDPKDVVAKFLVVKRSSGADNQGETVREYDYWYDYSADYATESNYEIALLQAGSKLVIDKAPLTIKVSPDNKVYNTADPTAYNWVKDPNNDTNNPFKYDDNASNVIITITRAEGEHVGEYAFNAVADNYEVTVSNKFTITTTNSIDGVTATFAETTDDFIYSGTPKEFVPVLSDANGTIPAANVTNPRWSTDRTNVGTVTVTVTLTGDYDDKDFSTTYAITKKELTIKAKNYALNAGAPDPASFAIEYYGWVNEEGDVNGPNRTKIPQSAASTTNPVFFKTPSGVKKVNTDAAGVYNLEVIEDAASNNYKFKYEEGKLTFGKAILDIYAVDANKTYGDKDPKFTLSLTVQQEGETSATPTDEKPITIGGVRQINPVRPGADTDEDAGTYEDAITFDKMPTVLAGYAVNYHKGDFTINKADLTITAKDQSKTYGQTDAEAQLKFGYTLDAVNVTGNKNNEATEDILTGTWTYYAWGRQPQQHTDEVIIAVECVSQNNPHGENAGEYTITPRLRGQAGQANDFLKNYNLVFKTGKLTINKAALIIKPIPQTKQFGEPDPDFTQLAKVLEVTGLQRNDTKESVLGQISNPGLTVEREKPSTQQEPRQYENVGNYHITAYRQLPGGKSYSGEIANYTWTIQNKDGNADIDLVITPVQLIVKALDQSIDYGAEINGYKVKFFKPAVVVADAQPAAAAEVEVEMSEETIKKIINPLTPSTTKVGVNENGFQWNGFKDNNYAIAQVEVDGVKKADFRNGYLTIYALQTIPLDEAELAKLELSAVKVIDEATGKDKDLLKKVLEDHKGLTVNVSLPGRKMDKDEWYAYVLPFEVTPRMLSNDNVWGYAAMETLDLNKSSEKSILFELQMFKVEPNTPFIVKIDKDLTAAEAKAIVLNNVTIDKEFDYLNDTPASEGNGVSFVGQYESTVGFGANQMYLAKVKGYDHREFWRGGEKSASVAFVSTNACLEFTDANAAAGARVYIEEEDGTVTAIGGVESDATVDSEGWYNVSGIKLNAAPAQKGIFIKDGKKVLVK